MIPNGSFSIASITRWEAISMVIEGGSSSPPGASTAAWRLQGECEAPYEGGAGCSVMQCGKDIDGSRDKTLWYVYIYIYCICLHIHCTKSHDCLSLCPPFSAPKVWEGLKTCSSICPKDFSNLDRAMLHSAKHSSAKRCCFEDGKTALQIAESAGQEAAIKYLEAGHKQCTYHYATMNEFQQLLLLAWHAQHIKVQTSGWGYAVQKLLWVGHGPNYHHQGKVRPENHGSSFWNILCKHY